MRSTWVIITLLCALCVIAAFSAGCTGKGNPTAPAATTPAPAFVKTPVPSAVPTPQVTKPAAPVAAQVTRANGGYVFAERFDKG
ncbi:MAG TPA: hypothetical protein VHN82_08410 [Methanoregula sp.]|nr:hypothetical protein [Methanoregula sp.]